MKYSISVIIPSRGELEKLHRSVPAVVAQLRSIDEVIVVHSGRFSQKIERFVTRFSKKNKRVFYTHQQKAGPSAARNKGILLAKGKIITFLDDDCRPQANWLESIRFFHTQYSKRFPEKHFILQGRITYEYGEPSLVTDLFHLRNTYDWQTIQETLSWKKGKFINFINAGNFSLRKEALVQNKIAFHETLFPFVGEEREIAVRFQLAGIPIVYEPKCEVIHFKKRGDILNSVKRSFFSGKAQSVLEAMYQTGAPVGKWLASTKRRKSGFISELVKQNKNDMYRTSVFLCITFVKKTAQFLGGVIGKIWLVFNRPVLFSYDNISSVKVK